MSETSSAAPNRRHRILIAKPGLDGHDRGAKVVVRALTEAGYEVIYTGLHQEPESVAEAALQEDVEVVGLSILSGAHMTLFPAVMDLLKQNGMGDVLVFGGGIVPPQDIDQLKKAGVGEIFTPGTDTNVIVKFLDAYFAAKDARK
ncbi:MAG: cobalamin B12-binding domain-containing protein [Planctomycetota bacterium]|nr:cobalamin B12-binding domain-containing protein [Planctomycetota bacterium]